MTVSHTTWTVAESLAEHPNGMRFTLTRADGATVSKVYYSVGGGFIKEEGEAPQMPSSGDGAALSDEAAVENNEIRKRGVAAEYGGNGNGREAH